MKTLIALLTFFATAAGAAAATPATPVNRCAVAVSSLSSGIAQGLMQRGFYPYEVRCGTIHDPRTYFGKNFDCVKSGFIAYADITDYGIATFTNPDPTGLTQFFITGYGTRVYSTGRNAAIVTLAYKQSGQLYGMGAAQGKGGDRRSAFANAAAALPSCDQFR